MILLLGFWLPNLEKKKKRERKRRKGWRNGWRKEDRGSYDSLSTNKSISVSSRDKIFFWQKVSGKISHVHEQNLQT